MTAAEKTGYPTQADALANRREIIEELAQAALEAPFRDTLWQRHQRLGFVRWLREQADKRSSGEAADG